MKFRIHCQIWRTAYKTNDYLCFLQSPWKEIKHKYISKSTQLKGWQKIIYIILQILLFCCNYCHTSWRTKSFHVKYINRIIVCQFFSTKPRTSTFHTIVLSYNSLPLSQYDGNSYLLQVFQPITAQGQFITF